MRTVLGKTNTSFENIINIASNFRLFPIKKYIYIYIRIRIKINYGSRFNITLCKTPRFTSRYKYTVRAHLLYCYTHIVIRSYRGTRVMQCARAVVQKGCLISLVDIVNQLARRTFFVSDHMTHMIRKSKSKTIRVIADVYVSIEGPASSLLDAFYGRLSRYVHEDPETTPGASLEDATSRLFSDLFSVVYRTVAAASEKLDDNSQFDEDYAQCLTGKATDIKPFSDVPYTLAKDISRTFAATNVLVHALR